MYESVVFNASNIFESSIFEDYSKKAEADLSRPLYDLKIDENNFNNYSFLINEMMDFNDINFRARSYHDSYQFDLDYGYTSSIDEYILSNPKVLFTRYEFCYLHDLYCLEIGIEKYHKRYEQKNPITIQEILNSKFYKKLLYWMNEFDSESLAIKTVSFLD